MADGKSGTFGATLSAVSFGFIGSQLFSFLLGVNSTSFALDGLFNNMNLTNVSNLTIYFTILFSWALGGLIAGIRAKEPTTGALGGFFGAFFGGILVILFFLVDDMNQILDPNNLAIDFSPIAEPLPGFLLGMIGTMIIATILGYGAGKATYSTPASKSKPKSSKRTWKDQKKWKCSRCGADIPPGEMYCPSCGSGVIQ